MTDIVSKEKRSEMMSNIRGKDTSLEMRIRKELFSRGYRYRLHDKRLPGKPDLVLPKYNAVVLINGCFWHGHNCGLYREPKDNNAFWRDKIARNRANDCRVWQALRETGWRILTVWECSIRTQRYSIPDIASMISVWLNSGEVTGEIRCDLPIPACLSMPPSGSEGPAQSMHQDKSKP